MAEILDMAMIAILLISGAFEVCCIVSDIRQIRAIKKRHANCDECHYKKRTEFLEARIRGLENKLDYLERKG